MIRGMIGLLCILAISADALGQAKFRRGDADAVTRSGQKTPGKRSLDGADVHVFKTVGDAQLKLYVFKPKGHKAADRRPAIVFFFGGGWTNGSPQQFAQQSRYLASRGMVAATAEYRVRSRHGATVPQCVADAKSAVRWMRVHAAELGIDPKRLAAGGGSAGGHLGGVVGVISGLDESGEDASVSSQPNAMVLFNPVMATAPADGLSDEYNQKMASRRQQFGGDPKAVSPLHHIRRGQPPVIMFFGSADGLKEGAVLFDKAYRKLGNRSELKIWDGPAHGFFNFGREKNVYFVETCREMDRFLTSLGYLDSEPTIEAFVEEMASGR